MNEDLVSSLRIAGRARDWNAAHAAVAALLVRLPAGDALALTHAEVARRLPTFEAHHPGLDGPRRLLEQIAAGMPPLDADPEQDDCTGPGGNNFSASLAALLRATRAVDSDTRARECARAIAEAIMAESTADWGSRFPAEWRRWYEAPPDDDVASSALITASSDPASAAVERAAWARLADELERRAAPPGSPS